METVIMPGFLMNEFLGQHSPAFSAMGTTGALDSMASLEPPFRYFPFLPTAVRVPSGKMTTHCPSFKRWLPFLTSCLMADTPLASVDRDITHESECPAEERYIQQFFFQDEGKGFGCNGYQENGFPGGLVFG